MFWLLRRNRAYRRLWYGEVVSFTGDWFNLIALYTIVIELSGGSARALAGVTIAKSLPMFFTTPVAGPLIDRMDRRRLLLITDFARALCALALIGAHHLESLPLLFTVLVMMVAFSGVFVPAKTAVLPQITTSRELAAANALSGGTWSVMLAVGAALGGVVTEILGTDWALSLDALSFLVSATALWGLPELPPRREEGDRSRAEAGFRAGLVYLRHNPYLAALISAKTWLALAGGAVVMIPLFGAGEFPETSGPFYIGAIYGLRGLGALAGVVLARRLFESSREAPRRSLAGAYLGVALSYCAVYLSPDVWTCAALYFVAAVGIAVVWVVSTTLSQQASRQDYRGRVFSLEWGGMTLTTAAASFLAGVAVDLWGWSARSVVLASGLLQLLPALGWVAVLAFLQASGPAGRKRANG